MMEQSGVVRVFERSLQKYQARHFEYLGDDDSKGYVAVKDTYGPNSVQKMECVGHVQKRVFGRGYVNRNKWAGLDSRCHH